MFKFQTDFARRMLFRRSNLMIRKTAVSQKHAPRGIIFVLFLMSLLLAACGTQSTPVPSTSTPLPTERIIPSLEPAPVMDTATAPPTATSSAANADVTFVRAIQAADGSWTFHVTVSHPDTGWDDYADGWDILTLNGTQLKIREGDVFTRLLAHPHVDEQPFTRSQSGIVIQEDITKVIARAHDIVDGFGGKEIIVDLEKDSGEGFEVEH